VDAVQLRREFRVDLVELARSSRSVVAFEDRPQ
jgi:hypothetical protein